MLIRAHSILTKKRLCTAENSESLCVRNIYARLGYNMIQGCNMRTSETMCQMYNAADTRSGLSGSYSYADTTTESI